MRFGVRAGSGSSVVALLAREAIAAGIACGASSIGKNLFYWIVMNIFSLAGSPEEVVSATVVWLSDAMRILRCRISMQLMAWGALLPDE